MDAEAPPLARRQQFSEPMAQLTCADLIACVDGLTARKQELAERIAELATDPAWWPTVAGCARSAAWTR